ncbi:Unc-89 [Strongyloides ratti]|uniref:Unc-89 n=1 Tax=Strongyloides ratti TaxID=34506 RepID=A0A090L773_STRRB|nr:Unc-89 [Strongyloides ratti]CEF63978.1 Unc-89 [Strongyloides ratti]
MCKVIYGKDEISSKCKLTVKKDNKELDDSTLDSTEIPKFHLLLKDTIVKVGEPIVLCVTNTTIPEPDNVEWYKDNDRIYPDNKKYFVMRDKGRYILETLNAEITDTGNYKVIGFNKNGKCTSSCQVTVTEVDLSSPPEFTVPLMNEKSQEKKFVKFEVYLIGSPSPTVKWYKDDIPIIHNDRIRIINDERLRKFSLTILDTKKTDEGNYKCIASNNVGEVETNCFLEIQESKYVQRQETNALAPTFIMPLPVIRELPEMVEVSLICVVTGEPQPSIRWYKDGQSLGQHIETTFQNGVASLIIRIPEISDSGVYTCEAINDMGVAKCSGVINIQESNRITLVPPKFVEPLTNTSVIEGNEIVLKCQLIGKPVPFITWYKDGLKLLMNNRMLQYVDRHGNVRFNILQARLDDSGEYTCEAQNLDKKNNLKDFTHCTVTVNESELTILSASPAVLNRNNKVTKSSSSGKLKNTSPPVILRKPSPITKIHEGNKELIEVEINEDSNAKVEWMFEDKPFIESNTVRTYFDGRIAFLKFFEANKFQQGMYKFIATNEYGSTSIETEVVIETMKSEHNYISKMPLFTKKLENKIVNLHDKVTLECYINSTPDTIVKWLLNGKTLHSSPNIEFHKYSKETESFYGVEFNDITEEEIGTITCVAINKYGECYNSCEIILINEKLDNTKIDKKNILQQKPVVVETLKDQTVYVGDNATLNCTIENLLSTKISWFKNGAEIFSSSKHQFEFSDGGKITLKINNCDKNDEGLYVCSASNDIGNEVTNCNLFVKNKSNDTKDLLSQSLYNEDSGILDEKVFPPKFTRTPLPNINIGEGKKLDVIVKAVGNPVPHISWMKDGKCLTRSNKIYQTRLIGNGEAVLTIDCPVLKSSGAFTCIAENIHGKETFEFNIIVTRSAFDLTSDIDEPPKFVKELVDVGVINNDSIELECELTGFPEPSVEWLFINDKKVTNKIDPTKGTWEESRIQNKVKLSNECITKSQQGTYQCLAINKNGTALTQCYVLVGDKIDEMAKPPKIIKKLQDKICSIGDDVEFDIEFEGYPSVDVLWYKDGNKITENLNCQIQLIDNNKSKLIIKNITLDDFGIYGVSLTNTHGQLEHVCCLKFGNKSEQANDCENNFLQDDEFLNNSTIKICQTEKGEKIISSKMNRQKSRDLVHLKKGTPPTFIVGLSDMNLKAGDCAAVTCKLANKKVKKRHHRDRNYDESKDEINVDFNATYFDTTKEEGNSEEVTNLETTSKTLDFQNSSVLEEIRRNILLRNKKKCRPKFFVKPKPKKVLDEFKSLRLKCAISANPAADVNWDKNGTILESGNKFSIYNDGNFYYLEVHNLSTFDGGFYNCSVVNSEGFTSCSSEIVIQPASDEKRLNFISKKGKNFSKPVFEEKFSDQINIETVEEFSLECIISGYPVPEIKWYKDGHEIVPHKNQFKISYDGEHSSLLFLKIDPSKNGKYICKATNSEGSTYCSTIINVVENMAPVKEEKNDVEPKFKCPSSVVKCTDGSEVKLIAILEKGSDPLGYQWIHNKVAIQDSSAFKYSREGNNLILTIKDAFPEDSGIYTCIAQNSVGYDTTNIELKIVEQFSKTYDIEDKPSIKPLTKKYTFKEGSVGEIIFNVSGNPEPVISWLNKNKQQILASSKYEMICKGKDFILRIHNMSTEDNGIYYLIAVNTVGTTIEKATINVAPKSTTTENETVPCFVKKLNDFYNFDIGKENIKLTVSYDGNPEPDVHWYINNEKIRTVDLSYKIITYKMKSTLTILKFDKDCVGEYLCIIRNKCGEDLSKCIVKIKDVLSDEKVLRKSSLKLGTKPVISRR